MTRISSILTLLLIAVSTQANYTGSEIQYFNPTADNMDFFTVHSSRTLPKGVVKTSLFFDYADDIHYGSDALSNNVIQGQLGFGLGLTDKMSFSVTGSGILDYDDEAGGKYTTDDITYVRMGLKYRFSERDNGGMAVIFNLGYGLIDPDLLVGDENDFGASVTLAYDRMLSERMRFGANLGYRYRNSGDNFSTAPGGYPVLPDTRDGSDVLASVALNYMFNHKWTGVTEIYTSLPTDQLFEFTVDDDSFDQKGGEFLLGANYKVNDRFDLGFGGVYGLFDRAQNANWRAFIGMGYSFGGAAEDVTFNLAGNSSAPAPTPYVAPAPVVETAEQIAKAPTLKAFKVTAKFASGSANLSDEAKGQLKEAGEFLQNNKYKMVFVEGHTDSSGKDEFNQMLSQRRAQMVKAYLVRTYKLDGSKVKAEGLGETKPVADNSTATGRATNRRVLINVK